MRFEISPKLYQVRMYDKHPDKYAACFQVYVDGDKGFINSLVGRDFYSTDPNLFQDMMRAIGIKSVEFYVLDAHARVIDKKLREHFRVERAGKGIHSGRQMIWIRLTLEG